MTSTVQHRISRIGQRAARAGLALAVVLAPAVVVAQSTQAQSFSVLYSFSGGADGRAPIAGLIADAAGNRYGTICQPGCGVVFKFDTASAMNRLDPNLDA